MARIWSFCTLFCTALLHAAFANPPPTSQLLKRAKIDTGLAVVIAHSAQTRQLAVDLAESGKFVVHLLSTGEQPAAAAQQVARDRKLGGRLIVDLLPEGSRLPYPDRFVNLLVADIEALKDRVLTVAEINRVLAVRGGSYLRIDGAWQFAPKTPDKGIDGWFAHWYNAAGNCVSDDRAAGFPQTVQWRHGPAMEDGTADGKIVRVADGRALFLDNLSSDLVCRDAGNGLLLWRRHLGVRQSADVSIAAGHVHVWIDHESKKEDRRSDRESGPLVAIALATGEIAKIYAEGVTAGTAAPMELPWRGRTKKYQPTPWFVVDQRHILQAYAGELVLLDRAGGRAKLDDATWFSPLLSGDLAIAAEATVPATSSLPLATDARPNPTTPRNVES